MGKTLSRKLTKYLRYPHCEIKQSEYSLHCTKEGKTDACALSALYSGRPASALMISFGFEKITIHSVNFSNNGVIEDWDLLRNFGSLDEKLLNFSPFSVDFMTSRELLKLSEIFQPKASKLLAAGVRGPDN